MYKEEMFRKNTPDTETRPPNQAPKPPQQSGQNPPRPPQQDTSDNPPRPPMNNQPPRPPRPTRPPQPPRPQQPPRPPYSSTIIHPIPQVQQGSTTSYVRFLNAIAGGPPVDIYLDGTLVASNLQYGTVSNYATITSNINLNHRVVVYQANTKGNPILQSQLPINRGSVYTGALAGIMPSIGLQSISIQRMEIPTQMAMLRFDHLSPNNTAIDVRLNGQTVFTCIPYWTATAPIGLYTGSYTIELLPCGSQTSFYTLQSMNLGAGAYTLYAIGILDGEPPFQAILIKD